MIERLHCGLIRPSWTTRPANRYGAHPLLRFAMIQALDDPEFVYVVTDQDLPTSVEHALAMVQTWRTSNEGTNSPRAA